MDPAARGWIAAVLATGLALGIDSLQAWRLGRSVAVRLSDIRPGEPAHVVPEPAANRLRKS